MTVQELINELEKIEDKGRTVVTTEYDSEWGTVYVRKVEFIKRYDGYYELDGKIIKTLTSDYDLNIAEVVDKHGNVTYY